MKKFLEMQVFVAVVEAGSFVKASDSLSLSKAAVSRHVAQLEERLGVRLLQRTTRRLSLTEEGEVFHVRCKQLLEELDEAEAEITSRSGEAVGELRVNAPVSFGIMHLAELWGGFKAMHPRLTLNVTLADRIVDLVEEGYDLAIRIARLPDSTLISRQLSSTRLILCASPGYLEQAGALAHPQDLAHHAVWSYSYFAGGDEWPFNGPQGRIKVRVRPLVHTNNGDTCLAGALQGYAIVHLPSFLVGPEIEAGRLVELLPDYRSVELGIYALYPTRRHVSPKVRLLIDFLAERFENPAWD